MIARFNLPWPPSVNRYWRSVTINGAARVLISREGNIYRSRVAETVMRNMQPGYLRNRIVHPVAVTIEAHAPDRRARDLDNLPKAILDSLTHAGVWTDDSLIDELHVLRRPVTKGGLVIVTIAHPSAHPSAQMEKAA